MCHLLWSWLVLTAKRPRNLQLLGSKGYSILRGKADGNFGSSKKTIRSYWQQKNKKTYNQKPSLRSIISVLLHGLSDGLPRLL